MEIQVIRRIECDTEIAVTCPYCVYFAYYDPRPGKRCCEGCEMHKDEIGDALVCPGCRRGSELTGDTDAFRELREETGIPG